MHVICFAIKLFAYIILTNSVYINWMSCDGIQLDNSGWDMYCMLKNNYIMREKEMYVKIMYLYVSYKMLIKYLFVDLSY